MYRQRLSNPYAGLSDGIQEGLSTLADSQVKMAQLQNERQLRDRDYHQRLQEFNADQSHRGEILKINQAQEAREAEKHSIGMKDMAVGRMSAHFAELQTEKGDFDFSNKDRVASVASQLQRDIDNNPYVAEAFGNVIAARTNGKYDRGRFVPGPNGFVVEMYNSKNPDVRGVMTDNASTDPNDPVTQLSPDQIISFVDLAETARYHGAAPSQLSQFLNPTTLEMGDIASNAEPAGLSVASRLGASGVTDDTSRPTAGSVLASPSTSPLTAPEVVERKPEMNNGLVGINVLDSVKDATRKTQAGLGQQVTEPALTEERPTSEKPKPAIDPGVIQLGMDLNNTGRIPTTASEIAAVKASSELSQRFLKETEADRRAIKRLAQGEAVRVNNLGRYLLGATLRGEVPEAQAVQLLESGRADVTRLTLDYIKSPSLAQAQYQLVARGGAGKAGADLQDKLSDEVTSVVKDAQSTLGGKAMKVDIGRLGTGIRTGLAYAVGAHPEDQIGALNANRHQVMAAVSRANRAISGGYHKDRDPDSVMAFYMMSEFRNVRAPDSFSDEDKIAYEAQAMDLLAKYKDFPPIGKNAVEVYRHLAASQGTHKVDSATIEAKLKEIYQRHSGQ